MNKLIKLLGSIETSIGNLKKKLKEKEDLKTNLDFAINALKLIAHTSCPDHPECTNAKLLQNIAKDALNKLI
jgi:hypothetical protein